MKKKFLYLFFHLNLFFSSLPIHKRKEVIKKCYWPLLNLINKSDFNVGIEITGWTLKEINKLDSDWIILFKKLLKQKKAYLIGSSYTQAIFPLIPKEINSFNIKFGREIYKKILNESPNIAYVNEQCFSKSVLDLYKNQKYKTLIVDWDSIKDNKNIYKNLKFYPQNLKGNKKSMKVIWNSSTNFQNFQKTIHSRLSVNEYFDIFNKVNNFKKGIVNIYGSDAEIFDFRLKRFENEAKISNLGLSEWEKIYLILNQFKKNFSFLNLNDLNKIKFESKFNNKLIDITSLKNNLPTKKQNKYNSLRWYVGGRDNYTINTLCWRLFLNSRNKVSVLKKLSYYWSSDFRTHIENRRWIKFLKQIKNETKKLNQKNIIKKILRKKIIKFNIKKHNYSLDSDKNNINYDDGKYIIKLDKERGLSLNSYGIIKKKKYYPYLKKFYQGHFSKQRLSVDLYSGHNVLENSKYKYSDLDKRGDIKIIRENNFITFSNRFFINDAVKVYKKWYFDIEKKKLYLHNKIKLKNIDFLSIRSNYFNINSKIFDLKNLKVSTKNGGSYKEVFNLNKNDDFFHDDPLSSKFTAQNCFGNTDGNINFFDNENQIDFKIYHQVGTCAPMLNFSKDSKNLYFLRLLTSFKENNDVKTKFINKSYESLVSINIKK